MSGCAWLMMAALAGQELTLEPMLYRPLAAQVIRVTITGGPISSGRLLAGWRNWPFEDLRVEDGAQVADVMAPREAASFMLAAHRGSAYAKALGYTGAPARGFDQIVGFPLELVPLTNPYLLRAGDLLPVRVISSGQPAPSILVSVARRPGPPASVVKTDARGVAHVLISGPGVYTLMATVQGRTTTLTFEFEKDRP